VKIKYPFFTQIKHICDLLKMAENTEKSPQNEIRMSLKIGHRVIDFYYM